MKQLGWILSAVLVAAGFLLFGQASKGAKGVSVTEAHDLIDTDTSIVVLDCRTPEEYTGTLGHVAHSILIPVQELESRLGELDSVKGRTIFAVCRTGRRSATATQILTQHGFKAINVEGGMVQWNAERLPVVKDGK